MEQYGAKWHDDLSTIPTDHPIIVIGNEFLDALPTHQMTWGETGWFEKVVKLDINDTMCLGDIEASDELISALTPFLIPPKLGAHIEVSLEQKRFLNDLMNIVLKAIYYRQRNSRK